MNNPRNYRGEIVTLTRELASNELDQAQELKEEMLPQFIDDHFDEVDVSTSPDPP